MNRFKKKRKDKRSMATVTYRQMIGSGSGTMINVINGWMGVKGLPMAFLRHLMKLAKCLNEQGDTFQELQKNLIDTHAQKDEDGQVITRKVPQGTEPTWADQAAADAAFDELFALTFECPALTMDDLEAHSDKLGLTLGALWVLEPIIVEEATNGNASS